MHNSSVYTYIDVHFVVNRVSLPWCFSILPTRFIIFALLPWYSLIPHIVVVVVPHIWDNMADLLPPPPYDGRYVIWVIWVICIVVTRRVEHVFPSSTRVELCLPRLQDALSTINWRPFTVVQERIMPPYRLHGPDALSRRNIGIQPALAELFPRIRFYFSATYDMFMYLFCYGRADSAVGAICVICMIYRICACKDNSNTQ